MEYKLTMKINVSTTINQRNIQKCINFTVSKQVKLKNILFRNKNLEENHSEKEL